MHSGTFLAGAGFELVGHLVRTVGATKTDFDLVDGSALEELIQLSLHVSSLGI